MNIDQKGEKYRKDVFADNGKLGCYETFELKPEFTQVLSLTQYPWMMSHFYSYYIANQIRIYAFHSRKYIVFWAWEGDGQLLIWECGKPYALLNSDCKCTYGWEKIPV